jgi:PAS domain S-box-containing protein
MAQKKTPREKAPQPKNLKEETPSKRPRQNKAVQEDITARKEAEREIRRLASFPELNPNPVLEVDQEGRVIYANPAAQKVATELGLSEGVSAFLPPDLQEKFAAARQGGPRHYAFDLPLNHSTYAVNLSFPHDFPTARVYAFNITERKWAEEALRESRKDLNRAQAVAHTGSWRMDVQQNALLWSDETYRIFGIPPGTPLTYETFLSAVHPEDKEYVDRKWTAALNGEPYDIEHRIVVGDTVKWVRERAELEFDHQGRLRGGFGTVQDITGRKLTEEALKRQQIILQGINRVLLEALTCETEEDLGRACLAVAEDLTGSKLGFIGEINQAGLLDDIAISDLGWSACKIPGTADRALPRNLHIHGIYGRVLKDGQSVIANDLAAHPDRVGTPEGHPPLTAFLGVPLKLGEKTIGMVGLGNKAGGYTQNDQEAVEHLSVAIVEAFQRKRAETALRRAHDELEEQVAERTSSLRLANELLLREIEERQAAEDRLRESETRFTAFMSHLPGPAVMRDIQGRYLFANVAWEKMMGKTRDEWQGKTLVDLWPPEMAKRFQQFDQQVLLAGESQDTLETLQLADGRHHFLIYRFPIRGRDGLPYMLGGIGIDITERVRAEEALEHERRRLFTVLEGIPAYVVLISPDCKILYANREFVQRFGHPGERYCYEFLFGLKGPCESWKALKVFDTGVRVEWEWAGPDGNTYQIYDYPFTDVDGAPLVLEMGVDITDRKRAEEARNRLIEIMEATPDFIGTANTDWRLTYLNYAARHSLGIKEDEDIAPINIRETHPQWAADLVFTEGLPAAAREGSWWGETAFLASDGREIPVSQVIVAHQDAAGQVQFFSTIARDISVLKQAREDTARQAAILNGINRILWETLAYESGEELGRVCLAVAEEMTDSRFGFIYELNDQGGFDVLACSDPGWDLGCISGVTDVTHLKNVQPVGLLARSLREGKAFVVNEPASHPEAAGAPPGHPPLTAYLGMPLISGGRTLGLLALGNKAGGYTPADQDAVEILAPTILEALMHHRTREDLQRSERRLRYLADQLLTAQENERKRLAAELHDELGHALLSLKLHLRAIERQMLPEQESLKEEIGDQLDHINVVIDNVRRLYHDLSPGDIEDLGLTKALSTLIQDFVADQPHLTCKVDLPDFQGLFSPAVETIIYRLVQEALTNIGKHAGPSSIMISALQEEQQVRLTIEDDGKGFKVAEVLGALSEAQGLGLASMEERLNMVEGAFQVWSQKGEGTRLTFSIPTLLPGNGL